ncbi:MAG: Alkaline phosphatase, partial [Friedmanniella sp.]|nr:Alkaline phosphatase [Friedmanniella sp.]
TLSPLAAESDGQANRDGGFMTVGLGMVLLVVLGLGVTLVGLLRRPRPQPTAGSASGPRRAAGEAPPRRSPLRLLLAALLVVGLGAAVAVNLPRSRAVDVTGPSPQYRGAQPVQDAQNVVVAAAGDISCPADKARLGEQQGPKSCQMGVTADLVRSITPDAVLVLGDNQYPAGSLADFQANYAKTWGAFRDITFPVPGNHEYGTPGAAGYYAYFGDRAGEPDKGYYSYDLGSWHVVALNSECDHIGGCSDASPQVAWPKADLAAHPRQCTLAYWHRPRFSSGAHGNNLDNDSLWRAMVAGKVDLVLNGHDHDYERFGPMDTEGNADPVGGTTEMVVGTGGASHYKFHLPEPTSLSRIADENGVTRLELGEGTFSWAFLQAPGGTSLDSGQTACH